MSNICFAIVGTSSTYVDIRPSIIGADLAPKKVCFEKARHPRPLSATLQLKRETELSHPG